MHAFIANILPLSLQWLFFYLGNVSLKSLSCSRLCNCLYIGFKNASHIKRSSYMLIFVFLGLIGNIINAYKYRMGGESQVDGTRLLSMILRDRTSTELYVRSYGLNFFCCLELQKTV